MSSRNSSGHPVEILLEGTYERNSVNVLMEISAIKKINDLAPNVTNFTFFWMIKHLNFCSMTITRTFKSVTNTFENATNFFCLSQRF